MIYELRKYVPHPGKAGALRERFEQVTRPIFSRLGIQVLCAFDDPEQPEVMCYLTAFASTEAREAAWAAFGADPEWKAAKAASEANGPLLVCQSILDLRVLVIASST